MLEYFPIRIGCSKSCTLCKGAREHDFCMTSVLYILYYIQCLKHQGFSHKMLQTGSVCAMIEIWIRIHINHIEKSGVESRFFLQFQPPANVFPGREWVVLSVLGKPSLNSGSGFSLAQLQLLQAFRSKLIE